MKGESMRTHSTSKGKIQTIVMNKRKGGRDYPKKRSVQGGTRESNSGPEGN